MKWSISSIPLRKPEFVFRNVETESIGTTTHTKIIFFVWKTQITVCESRFDYNPGKSWKNWYCWAVPNNATIQKDELR